MSRPFYSDAKKVEYVSFFFSFFSSSHFLFPCDFLGTIADTDIINTLLEPLQPTDVPFGGFVDIASHFRGEIPPKPQFWGRE